MDEVPQKLKHFVVIYKISVLEMKNAVNQFVQVNYDIYRLQKTQM